MGDYRIQNAKRPINRSNWYGNKQSRKRNGADVSRVAYLMLKWNIIACLSTKMTLELTTARGYVEKFAVAKNETRARTTNVRTIYHVHRGRYKRGMRE